MARSIYLPEWSKVSTNRLLRSVYEWMMIGLLVSGFSALATAHSPFMLHLLFGNPWTIWILIFVELALVVALSAGIDKMDVSTARVLFIFFSIIDGMTLSSIFLVFTETSIASAFFISALTFGVMSLYGYFTDADLSSWGTILIAGLIGIIIAMVVNFFLHSPTLEWWIDIIGVIIFVGLTAYDTQKIKQMGAELAGGDPRAINRAAIVGALALYLDFINLFIMFLDIFGNRRE